jgi:6-phospho-beta-glucosidase
VEDEIMDAKGKILTIIGGGSFFTPSFIGTMCRMPEVWAGAEIRLNDLDRERVRLVIAFCEKFTHAKKVPMTFRDEPDMDRALAGADFVITTFRVGGIPSLMMDETIPTRFGYFGDETAGPGGLFMAIRTVPVALDVAKRMKRLCPEAWLLNYANPTNYITDALHRSGFTRSVGLCDGYTCAPRGFAFTLDIPKYLVHTRHAGLNHCGWVYKAETDGRDLMAELRTIPQEVAERNLNTKHPDEARELLRFLEIFRVMGLFPALSEHQEPYFFHDELLAEEQCGHHAHEKVAENSRANWDRLKAVLKDFNEAAADDVAKAHQGAHADLAIGVANALATDSGEEFPVNRPHGDAMKGFPPETVLEVYSRVTKQGFEPVRDIPAFPKVIIAQQLHLAMVQQILVQGILEKDRRLLMQAFAIHPFTKSFARARACFETMWQEEQVFLGDYWRGGR